ncbi:hypothetical protein GW17_00049626 [Ensete ventricosum]|nr:hypothetical protein GW17_00049626 [Ensete ventricosum]RZS11993.1 hypothetical protein BHM03_00043371 [Ensete ventricosum]
MATANRFDLLDIGEAVHNNFSPPCSIRLVPIAFGLVQREATNAAPSRGGVGRGETGDGRGGRGGGTCPNHYFGNGNANGISKGYGGGGGGYGDRLLERERPPRQPFGGGFAVDMGGSGGNGNEDSGGDSERILT